MDNVTGEVVAGYGFSGAKGMIGVKFGMRAISVYRYLADALLKEIR